MAQKCNQMIETENKMFEDLQNITNTMSNIDKNINTLKSSLSSCLSVVKLYNNFIENNNKYITKINTDFEQSWNEFQSYWTKWSVKDMITWFKYNTKEMNTDDIKWNEIEEQLKKRNISGNSLKKFSDLTLELLGIHDFEIVNHLLSKIDTLKKTYPCLNNKVQAKSDKNVEIPKEYICPITKRIMMDPVLAFDGHSYEREAIEDYLKINNKSPITGEEAQYLIVFPNHKLKADIQKFIKENNIDLKQQKEGISEVGKETYYH